MSFVTVGLFVSTIGFSIGLNADVFRLLAALLMVLLGVVLIVPRLQEEVAVAAGPAGWASDRLTAVSGQGIGGQFVVGLLFGAVWSPCVGPTLGAASVLAAQRQNLPEVGKRCAAGTLTSLLKIGRDHLPVADAGDKDAPWNLFALSL